MADTKKAETSGKAKEAVSSKMEGVRRALQELGKKALPLDVQRFLKDNFGLVMTRDQISKYKSHLARKRKAKKAAKAKAGTTKRVAKKKGVRKTVAATAAAAVTPAPRKQGPSKNGIELDDVHVIKGLVHRVGAEQLRALIKVLGG